MQIALPVVGQIGRAGLLEASNEPTMELVQLRDQQLRGYRVRDDSMAPVFRPGQLALTLSELAGAGALLGRDALVELPDGRALLRRLCRAATRTAGTSLPTTHPFYPWSRCKRPDPLWVSYGPRLGARPAPLLPRAYPLQLMRNSRFAGSLKNAVYFSQLWVIGKPAGRSRPCRPRE